jgi:hypothetical protein
MRMGLLAEGEVFRTLGARVGVDRAGDIGEWRRDCVAHTVKGSAVREPQNGGGVPDISSNRGPGQTVGRW